MAEGVRVPEREGVRVRVPECEGVCVGEGEGTKEGVGVGEVERVPTGVGLALGVRLSVGVGVTGRDVVAVRSRYALKCIRRCFWRSFSSKFAGRRWQWKRAAHA